jgi:hypothetical protein
VNSPKVSSSNLNYFLTLKIGPKLVDKAQNLVILDFVKLDWIFLKKPIEKNIPSLDGAAFAAMIVSLGASQHRSSSRY